MTFSAAPLNEHPYMPVTATATSGAALNGIDGVNDVGNNTFWTSSTSFPQSLILDLGSVKPDVGYFGYSGNGPVDAAVQPDALDARVPGDSGGVRVPLDQLANAYATQGLHQPDLQRCG